MVGLFPNVYLLDEKIDTDKLFVIGGTPDSLPAVEHIRDRAITHIGDHGWMSCWKGIEMETEDALMPASELCAFEILRFRPHVGSKRLFEGLEPKTEPEASKCLPRKEGSCWEECVGRPRTDTLFLWQDVELFHSVLRSIGEAD